MRKFCVLKPFVWLSLTVAVVLSSIFYAAPTLKGGESETKAQRGAVRLWNVDTFEGGKGSRTAFLNRVSAEYEKENDGTYVLVSSYTAEGASAAFDTGNYPDMISFGIGLSLSKSPVRTKIKGNGFAGGEVNGECLALPWCRGVYAVYSLEENFEEITDKNTVLSSGGKNLVSAAAALLPLIGEPTVKESTAAYVSFLNGKTKYLLGTQRDACRFAARGVNVYCKPIEGFSDLYQYIAVLTEDKDRQAICEGYIESLLSEKSQKKLTDIGMLSPYFDVYTSDAPLQDELERADVKKTVGVFISQEGLTAVDEAAKRAMTDGNTEVLKNFLKSV